MTTNTSSVPFALVGAGLARPERLNPPAVAMEAIMVARMLDADEALACGLIGISSSTAKRSLPERPQFKGL